MQNQDTLGALESAFCDMSAALHSLLQRHDADREFFIDAGNTLMRVWDVHMQGVGSTSLGDLWALGKGDRKAE